MAEAAALDAAAAIGARLCREALWCETRCSWGSDRLVRREGSWQRVHGALAADLYEGTAGVALFLARLQALSGEALLRRVAEAALRQSLLGVERLLGERRPGYFDGVAGIAHACLECGTRWQSEAWLAEGRTLLEHLLAPEVAQAGPDYLSGRAGVIAVLLRWRDALPAGRALAAAVDLAGQGWAAASPDDATIALQDTGAAHGSVGPAWVLAALAAASGAPGWYQASTRAWQGFRTRRAALVATAAAARTHARRPVRALGWCQGAAGIALAQLRCLEEGGDPGLATAHAAVLASGLQALRSLPEGPLELSLCHGLGGVVEWLTVARRQAGAAPAPELDAAVADLARRFIRLATAAAEQGLPDGLAQVGLMPGWAGIGESLLRLHQPALPSVLMP